MTATDTHPIDVDAYLDRIGAARPAEPTFEALCELQERHMTTVPFETLDFALGGVPSMKDEDVYDKIVRQRRGGGCGELNSGFALLLRALGYRVSLLGGRVLHNGREAFRGVHNGHLVLLVEIDQPYVVDVGFRWAARRPLKLHERGVQHDAHGGYQLQFSPYGDIEMVHDGVLRWQVETHPRELDDFTSVMWYCATSPEVPGKGQLWASIVTATGRVSLFNRILTEHGEGAKESRELADDAEFLKEFEHRFGITLDAVPELAPVPAAG